MSERVRAAVAVRQGTIEVQSFPLPEIGPRDMLVQVRLCGVCGSDLHLLRGDWGTPFPVILGHEFVGTVAQLGSEAREHHGVDVGDRVTVEMIVPCHECYWCRKGYYNLCAHDKKEGWEYGCNITCARPPHLWGGWAEYLYVPIQALVHRIPDHLPWEAAVLVEPLAVATRAVNLTPMLAGDTVAVVGPGTIGLLTTVAAKAAGAGTVILIGTRDSRLELGRALGADVLVNTARADARQEVLGVTGGRGADVVFETAGTPAAQQQALELARAGATVTILGLTGNRPVTLDLDRALMSPELRVQASFLSAWGYQGSIATLRSRRFPVEQLVTHVFPLEQAAQAVRFSAQRLEDCVKVAIGVA